MSVQRSTSAPRRPAAGCERVTYALALLDEPVECARAVRELIQAGVSSSRISVFACDDSLATRIAAANDDDVVALTPGAQAAAGVNVCPRLPAWVRNLVAASAGVPRTAGASDIGPCEQQSCVLDRHARMVDEHLRSGGGLVVVQLESPDEQIAVCSTLLAHSRRGVQTHEIRRSG